MQALRINDTNVTTLWSWSARNSNLPQWSWALFSTTDECKPCPGGTVLVTSSGGDALEGAVALVNPKTSNALFFARTANAHSADLLPSNRVAVALSYRTNGNRVVVFDLDRPDQELFSVGLFGAHGVVWDSKRQVLWAMADASIVEYSLQDWDSANPLLMPIETTPLPESGGHDMYPVPNSPYLTISTVAHCYLFDRDSHQFTKHPLMGDISGVKGISSNPAGGQIVYVKAEISWWSEHLMFENPQGAIQTTGEQYYKARWLAPDFLPLVITVSKPAGIEITWPAIWTGYVIEENAGFQDTGWIPATGNFLQVGTNNVLSVTNIGEHRLYRLRRSD